MNCCHRLDSEVGGFQKDNLNTSIKRVLGLILWSLHVPSVSVWVFCGYTSFLPQSKNMQTGV